jgi:NADPH-dependent 7-cyano-7-deazaguanine reductase QueF
MASNIADFISWAVEYIFLEAGYMEEKELERWIRAFRGDRQLKEYVVEYIEDELEFAQDLLKRARFLKKKFGVRS